MKQAHLTQMFDTESEQGYRKTPPGMAFWTGTGPKGTTCRECGHWHSSGRYASASPRHALGELKPGHCGKYKQMAEKQGAPIRHMQASCKYFEASKTPPQPVQHRS